MLGCGQRFARRLDRSLALAEIIKRKVSADLTLNEIGGGRTGSRAAGLIAGAIEIIGIDGWIIGRKLLPQHRRLRADPLARRLDARMIFQGVPDGVFDRQLLCRRLALQLDLLGRGRRAPDFPRPSTTLKGPRR